MDSFFGIGLPELILILLLSGLVMGPQRIRKVAYTLGRYTAQLQQISRQFARQLNAELDALEDGSVRDTVNEMRELQREVQELRQQLKSVPQVLNDQAKVVTEEAEEAMRGKQPTRSEGEPRVSEPAEDTQEESILPKAIEVPGDPD